LTLVAALAALLALTACAQPARAPADTLTVGVSRALVEGPRDPYFVHASLRVWESLVELDDSLEPRPLLAESWSSSPDARTWTFKIRPNVRFHDGTALDASAVVANVERFLKISPRASPFFLLDKSLAYSSPSSSTSTSRPRPSPA
jgi:peptide/nickel transport system substrate-binding protein